MKFSKLIYLLIFILISSVVLGGIAVGLASAIFIKPSGAGFEFAIYLGIFAFAVVISVVAQLLMIGGILIFKGAKNDD